MYVNKAFKHVLTFVIVLFVISCNQAAEQSSTLSSFESVNDSVVNPVIVEAIQDAGKTYLHFNCYEIQDCYSSIPLPMNMEWLSTAELNKNGDLFVPIRTRIQEKENSVGFILANKSGYKIVTTSIAGFNWYEEINQTIFSEGRMIFTIDGDQNVYILDEFGNVKNIFFADMDPYAPYRIVKGNKGEIIVVGQSLQKQNRRNLIDISVINLQNNTVKTELIPWPEFC